MGKEIEEIRQEARAAMEYHCTREGEPLKEFEISDKVWLVTTNIKTKRPMKKRDDKKVGPFTITEKISSHTYKLNLPKTMRIHNMFHVSLLSEAKEDTDFHRQQVKPPPVLTEEGEEEYEVERIINWEQRKGGLYYQIRWVGYGPHEDTMERAEKIAELSEIMQIFLKEHPTAPIPSNYKPPKPHKKTTGRTANLSFQLHTTPTTTTTTITKDVGHPDLHQLHHRGPSPYLALDHPLLPCRRGGDEEPPGSVPPSGIDVQHEGAALYPH
jgi:hypothetical protein